MQVKILSWNIWLDGDLEAVIAFVRNSEADIIGMQEVIPEREPNILDAMTALGYQHSFAKVTELHKDGKEMGNAIFSRFPIVESKTHTLSDEERRLAEEATIDVEGIQLHVFNTHLLHTHQKQSGVQDSQVKTLVGLLPTENTIVMGDFNAIPQSSVIQKMEGLLVNTDPSHAPTWSTDPAGCSGCDVHGVTVRLDYIFASRDLATRSPLVYDSKASDHLPVSCIIEL